MERYYRFSKKISDEQAEEVVKELEELASVKRASVEENNSYLRVSAEPGDFPAIMGMAVNICNRKAGGAELSFSRISYEY